MSYSNFTNLGSNQDPDDWYDQRIDREREQARIEWENNNYSATYPEEDFRSNVEKIIEKGLD